VRPTLRRARRSARATPLNDLLTGTCGRVDLDETELIYRVVADADGLVHIAERHVRRPRELPGWEIASTRHLLSLMGRQPAAE